MYQQQQEIQRLKQLQVQSLKKQFPLTTSPATDVYDVPVTIANTPSIFRVQLPNLFPHQAPYLILLGIQGVHQNLGSNGLIQHSKLMNWSPHSNFAGILNEIIQLFVNNPPNSFMGLPGPMSGNMYQTQQSMYQTQQQNVYQTQQQFQGSFYQGGTNQQGSFYQGGPSQQGSFTNQSFNQPKQYQTQQGSFYQGGTNQQGSFYQGGPGQQGNVQQTQQNYIKTEIPNSFKEVQLLGESKAKSLLSSEEEFEKFFNELEYVKNTTNLLKDLQGQNDKLKDECEKKELEVKKIDEQTTFYRNEMYQILQSSDQKVKLKKEQESKFSQQFLIDLLKQKTNEADEKSHEIAENYLKNKDVSQFLTEFIKERELYYSRKTKLDRFK